jgi:hypothetical protein
MLNLPYSQCLTNELLSRQSKSQFELVGRAIKVADYLIKSGKAATDWPDNVAFEVLCRMADEGVDQLEHEVMQEEG